MAAKAKRTLLLAEEVPDSVECAGEESQKKDGQVHAISAHLDQDNTQNYCENPCDFVRGSLLVQDNKA